MLSYHCLCIVCSGAFGVGKLRFSDTYLYTGLRKSQFSNSRKYKTLITGCYVNIKKTGMNKEGMIFILVDK